MPETGKPESEQPLSSDRGFLFSAGHPHRVRDANPQRQAACFALPRPAGVPLEEFKASTAARLAGFAVFLLILLAVMLGSAALLALGRGLAALGLLLPGGGLASFLGVLTTGRLSRRERAAWQARQADRPFVMPADPDPGQPPRDRLR